MRKHCCFWLLIMHMSTACVLFSDHHQNDLKQSANVEELMRWLSLQPRENIQAIPAVKAYLDHHKVFIGLTSSPLRVQYLGYVLRTLDLTHVEKIIVSLPERYERDDTSYDVPEELVSFPKLVINRSAKDAGPLTKLVAAADYIKHHYQADGDKVNQYTLITIDDDTGYPAGMVNEIIKQLVFSERTVVAAAVQRLDYWQLPPQGWPQAASDELLQGFGGAGYRLAWIDSQELTTIGEQQRLETGHRSCFLSDDLVISYVLAKAGIARRRVLTRYYQRSAVIPYPFSFGDDALERLQEDAKKAGPQQRNATAQRYAKCLDYMSTKFPAG